jgi:hypothetical protein
MESIEGRPVGSPFLVLTCRKITGPLYSPRGICKIDDRHQITALARIDVRPFFSHFDRPS